MKFVQPPLPYGFGDLEPTISSATMHEHYDVHQKGYVDKLNAFPEIKALSEGTSLEDVLFAQVKKKPEEQVYTIPQQAPYNSMFDTAAQVWNHTFFWNSMKKGGGGDPTGAISDGIRINFGTFERFRETMRMRALSLFGSGWLWLGVKGDALWVMSGSNAALPLVYGIYPVLTIDLWEHAYYLDYKADRAKYFDQVMDSLVDWEFVNKNIENAVY
jgi:Fe-Mn family superoxide dismutase